MPVHVAVRLARGHPSPISIWVMQQQPQQHHAQQFAQRMALLWWLAKIAPNFASMAFAK
jgi:hypothetical protein